MLNNHEIDRQRAISESSLAKCRFPQFRLHFRGELPSFNVVVCGNNSGQDENQVALRFRTRSRRPRGVKGQTGALDGGDLTSEWSVRYPELRSGCTVAVPILYQGNWSRAAIVSLLFAVHNKSAQRLCYSKGELLLIDDLCDSELYIRLLARNEDASDDLKGPVFVHMFMDVWDVNAPERRTGPTTPIPQEIQDDQNDQIDQIDQPQHSQMFRRIDGVCSYDDDDNSAWPDSTDFLIEIPIDDHDSSKDDQNDDDDQSICDCGNCQNNRQSSMTTTTMTLVDENANFVLEKKPSRVRRRRSVQFFCHQTKLAEQSDTFDELFRSDWTKDTNVLRVRSVGSAAVELFLNFLYTGRLYVIEPHHGMEHGCCNDYETLVEVLSLANRYQAERLIAYCDVLLTDRYLNLECAADRALLADRYELPCLGQAALSLLSWSLDEEYWRPLSTPDVQHLLLALVKEAGRKHMLSLLIGQS